ncbi:peptidase S8 and S53 domain-containing protein [Planoprotostelium fungivorum]|uniref:Peptidase S8 and S53 domain-containing protein n=1 Tax=Planoprotostelium fungivorum TaxID=1890364 RepID=A0A2P6NRW9_9EUKA|nr:peptidase S8 and S53 domain-containing protein [Planoprotostelium fungivorum]
MQEKESSYRVVWSGKFTEPLISEVAKQLPKTSGTKSRTNGPLDARSPEDLLKPIKKEPRKPFTSAPAQPNCCRGCGCELQSSKPKELGYIPPQGHRIKEKPKEYIAKKDFNRFFTPQDFLPNDFLQKYVDSIVETKSETPQKIARIVVTDQGFIHKDDSITESTNSKEETMDEREKSSEVTTEGEASDVIVAGDEAEKGNTEESEMTEEEKQEAKEILALKLNESINWKKKKSARDLICNRCFQLKYHNKVIPVRVPIETFKSKLSAIGYSGQRVIVYKVVDVFDFDGSFIPNMADITGRNPVVLIMNKMDILPTDVSRERIKNWARREAKNRGIHNVVAVHLVSSMYQRTMETLLKDLENIAEDQQIFVMGTSNAGKSTLINKILDAYRVRSHATVSAVPGTTLSTGSFKLPEGPTLWDTPGVHNPYQLTVRLNRKDMEVVVPKARIKPMVWSLRPGHTIFLGGLARIDFKEGNPGTYFTIFVASTLKIHVCKTIKADQLYENHVGGMLSPPTEATDPNDVIPSTLDYKPLKPLYKARTIRTEGMGYKQATMDIVISGLGWVAVTGEGAWHIEVQAPRGVDVGTREPLLGFETPTSKNPDVKVHKVFKARRRTNERCWCWVRVTFDVPIGWITTQCAQRTSQKHASDMRGRLLSLVFLTLMVSGLGEKRSLLPAVSSHPHFVPHTSNDNETFSFDILLRQQNLDVIEKAFWAVSDPKHPDYGKHWTRELIEDTVRPKKESFQQVLIWLERDMPYAEVHLGPTYLRVTSTIDRVQSTFQSTIKRWKNKKSGRSVHRLHGRASFPSHLEEHIHLFGGLTDLLPLDDGIEMVETEKRNVVSQSSSPITPVDKSYTGTISAINSLYNINYNTIKNSKTTAAIFGFFNYFEQNALNDFLRNSNLAGNTPVAVGDVTCLSRPANVCGTTESDLDVQMVAGIAQNIKLLFVSSAPPSAPESYYLLESIEIYLGLAPFTPQVISISYVSDEDVCFGSPSPYLCGTTDSYLDRTDTEIMKLGLMGVSVMAASGDYGVIDVSIGNCPPDNTKWCPKGGCSYSSSQCQQVYAPFDVQNNINTPTLFPLYATVPTSDYKAFFSANSKCKLDLDFSDQLMYSTCTCDQLVYGKYGSTTFSAPDYSNQKNYFGVNWPATSAYVTAVGGTKKSGDTEVVCSIDSGAYISSGGGFSRRYLQPAYQKYAVGNWSTQSTKPPAGTYDTSYRGFPDVSLLAHQIPISRCDNGGGSCSTIQVDGTSASTPLLAAMISLINDQRISSGRATLGFLNPLLYQAAQDAPDVFRDITSGDNRFDAVTGWDPVTGLGSIDFSRLSQYALMTQFNVTYNTALDSPYAAVTRVQGLPTTGDSPRVLQNVLLSSLLLFSLI